MENNSDNCGGSKNEYIYLDFNGKISSDVFQNQFFFRIANLHKKNPLVQVNDNLFKGTYDTSMGTNLFFEEADDNSPTNNITFEKQTPKCLKHFQSTTKVLNLQQVKIPQVEPTTQTEIKNINYNLAWDYNELLQKLENGTLNIEDISSGEIPPQKVVLETEEKKEEKEDSQTQSSDILVDTETELDAQLENALSDITPAIKRLEAEYEQLNILARRPVRRAISPELITECDKKYEDAFEYHNIERQILQPRDGFKTEVLHVDENTLSDCIDIDRCMLYGLIPASSDFPRVLSKEEKEKLLTLENFDNLSLVGRYYVLQNIVSDLEEYVQKATPKELEDKDEYGRTPVQTLEIYKKLTNAVKNRLQEIKFSLSDGIDSKDN